MPDEDTEPSGDMAAMLDWLKLCREVIRTAEDIHDGFPLHLQRELAARAGERELFLVAPHLSSLSRYTLLRQGRMLDELIQLVLRNVPEDPAADLHVVQPGERRLPGGQPEAP